MKVKLNLLSNSKEQLQSAKLISLCQFFFGISSIKNFFTIKVMHEGKRVVLVN